MYLKSFLKIGNQFRYYLLSIFVIIFILFSTCMEKPGDRETRFWHWFKANNLRLHEQKEPQEKLFDELSIQLKKVNPNITFEFSPVHSDGVREFTISADGLIEYFPI